MSSPLSRIISINSPRVGNLAERIRFVPHFEQLWTSWTANSPISEGVERFVEEYWPIIRANNPHVEFRLQRSYVQCDPFLVGRFKWSRFRKHRLCFKHQDQILAMVEQFSIGGDFRIGRKRKVATILPRGQQIWDTETKGHDVFKVYSRWKGDPVDPAKMVDVKKHPHYLYRYINACRK